MKGTTSCPKCELCGEPAAYLINGSLYFCEACRGAIGDEWEDVITVEEIDDDDEWED